jgi:hypothetical protein
MRAEHDPLETAGASPDLAWEILSARAMIHCVPSGPNVYELTPGAGGA